MRIRILFESGGADANAALLMIDHHRRQLGKLHLEDPNILFGKLAFRWLSYALNHIF